jgi:RNA-directed DNA polymerase
MTKAPISLQDLRRRIYRKAKAEPAWRCWGLYVHVCKLETLREAYRLAKHNDGAPGTDGATFEAIEAEGLDAWLQQLRVELLGTATVPCGARLPGRPVPPPHAPSAWAGSHTTLLGNRPRRWAPG